MRLLQNPLLLLTVSISCFSFSSRYILFPFSSSEPFGLTDRVPLWYLLCFYFSSMCKCCKNKCIYLIFKKPCVGFHLFFLSEGLCVTKDCEHTPGVSLFALVTGLTGRSGRECLRRSVDRVFQRGTCYILLD